MPLTNTVILAAAGSRKTTSIVDEALASTGDRVLVTTYTLDNLRQLRTYFERRCGCVPAHITLMTWYSFLVQHCVRPYQRRAGLSRRVKGLYFDVVPPAVARRVPKKNRAQYYLTADARIYRDRTAEFAVDSNVATGGLTISRLEQIWSRMFVDEVQDLAGWDLDVLDALFASKLTITCVGDVRQATYATANTVKNGKYRGRGMWEWFQQRADQGTVGVTVRNESYRCNQAVCDFADGLYPDMPATKAVDVPATNHDGVVRVRPTEVEEYVREYCPVVMRYSRAVDVGNLNAINFGAAKGLTFDRVLIFPTKEMFRYFDKGVGNALADATRAKFYVAITRARFSVGIVG
jgi:DNA helicase II / ATP-dependent DNA helicase PcrA